VSETAINPYSSDTTTIPNYINVYNQTSNTFTPNTTLGYIPLPVSFTSTNTNATMWNWSFGDGYKDNGTNTTVSHTYIVANNNTVTLTTSDRGYGVATTTHYVNSTFYAPSAGFIATPMSGNAPLLVTFTDTSVNSPTAWNWSFGDGSPFVYSQNTTHTYAVAGTYTVTLDTTSPFGTSNFSQVVSVFALGPVANFTENTTIGSSPLAIQFTDTSSYTAPATWNWSFGDGTYSSSPNPVHSYSVNGVYNVYLTVTDAIGTTTSGAVPVYVTSNPIPLPNFIGSPTSGTAPLNVTFNDLTIGGKTGWNWTFGDGNYSNIQNPVHNYTTNGQYTVTLVVANGSYSNYTTKVGYINVGIGTNFVNANYTATPTSGDYPLTVQFYDTSVCSPICNSWNWDLDGDGSTDSNAQNPTFTYNYPLTYSPKLIASNGLNSGTKIRLGYIVVGPAFIPPTIPQPTESWVPGYKNQSSGLIVTFQGDSSVDLPNSSYLRYWLQNFTATGNFNVYGFVTSIMAPLMHVFGFWIFLIIWGLYIFAVWIRAQDVTLPLIIGIISMGTFGLLFPKEALPVIIIMFVICGAIIITKLMKDSI